MIPSGCSYYISVVKSNNSNEHWWKLRSFSFLETQFSLPRKVSEKVHKVHILQADAGPKAVGSRREPFPMEPLLEMTITDPGQPPGMSHTPTETRMKHLPVNSWPCQHLNLKPRRNTLKMQPTVSQMLKMEEKQGNQWHFCEHFQKKF